VRRFLFAAFFLSGFTGLVYETVWARYLGLLVGHGAYGQAAVLVLFLGGLAVGALLVGRRSERIGRPLLWYGGVEVAVGLYGLAFHSLFQGIDEWAREVLFPTVAGVGLLPGAKGFLAALLVLPPAVLLGATLPLISAGLLRRRPDRPGRTLALLYFVNSLGAALGAPVAGFVLVAYGGLPGALSAAGIVNLAVGGGVLLVARGTGEPAFEAQEERRPGPGEAGPSPGLGGGRGGGERLWRLLLAVSFGTAVASFVYEIAWIRMLSLVLGAATHAFELMLSAFILGLALGAFWVRTRADHFEDPVRALGWIQWIMGLAALATLPVYLLSFEGIERLLALLRPTEPGYAFFNAARYGFALAVMLPATVCAGAVLPLITRILLATPRGEGAVGWVYGVNTGGAIVGVLGASLVLLPLVGVRNLLLLGAAGDMLLGAVLLSGLGLGTGRLRREGALALLGAGAVVVGVGLGVGVDRSLLASGVFRDGSAESPGEVLYYRDGRTASVAVVERPDGSRTIATNGKVDASVGSRWLRWAEAREGGDRAAPLPPLPRGETAPLELDEPTQSLLGLVTLAHRPGARRGGVVGHGSGITAHLLLGSPVLDELVTVELEEAMVEGSRHFAPVNRRVFEDPRSRIVLDDARSFFAAHPGRFDLVVSAPSNPWVRGVSGLFTVEFYETLSRRLRPGGVFGQWIQLYEIDDELVLHVLAALHRVFPSYHVFQLQSADLLVVASNEAELPEPSWEIFELPGIRRELAHTEPFTPPLLEAMRVMDRRALKPLLDRWERPNSEFHPVLDLGAERTRFLGSQALGFLAAGAPSFDPTDPFRSPLGPNALSDLPGRSPVPGISRLEALARTGRVRLALEEDPAGLGAAELPGQGARGGEGGDLAPSLYGYRRFLRVLEAGQGPLSWRGWTWDAREAIRLLHEGLDGPAEPELFGALEAYLERWDAPSGPRAAVALRRALLDRRWSRAADAAPVLSRELEEGREWVDPELLLDAGTIALLLEGSIRQAREHRGAVGARVSRAPWDLRERLLDAYVAAADAGRLPVPVHDPGG